MRNFTYITEAVESECNDGSIAGDVKREMIERLAREWNEIEQQRESRSWLSHEERLNEESEAYYAADDAGEEAREKAREKGASEEEANAAYKAAFRYTMDAPVRYAERLRVKQEAIEELLSTLGARMMRPYEHWNEEERHIEYLENRYNNEDLY